MQAVILKIHETLEQLLPFLLALCPCLWRTLLLWHILKKQHSKAQPVQEVPGKQRWQLSDTGCGGSHKEWCAAPPHTNKEGRPCWRCEGLGQLWLPLWTRWARVVLSNLTHAVSHSCRIKGFSRVAPADVSCTVPRAQVTWWGAKERATAAPVLWIHLAWFLQDKVHNLK